MSNPEAPPGNCPPVVFVWIEPCLPRKLERCWAWFHDRFSLQESRGVTQAMIPQSVPVSMGDSGICPPIHGSQLLHEINAQGRRLEDADAVDLDALVVLGCDLG
jgi:hypothetical protein